MPEQPFAGCGDSQAAESPDCLRYSFDWPRLGPAGECDNFFAGVWHPRRPVVATWADAPAVPHSIVRGRNWALMSAASPLSSPPGTLVHADADGSWALAFRGYVCEPALHSYSPSEALRAYWGDERRREHNGVFAAASVTANGAVLRLVADALGFGPLYYRRAGGGILFATNPRFLVAAGDAPDLLAWRCLIESGFIGADRSLSQDVQRLPAGQMLEARGERVEFPSWCELDRFPRGDRPLDGKGIAEVESVFQQAMDRCLALAGLDVVLPLSSGHDSRRMLAALIHRKAEFEALTSRVFHKGHDLDARFAIQMATDLHFPHRVVEPADPQRYAVQDRVRRILTDSETGMHSWVPGLVSELPGRPAMILDGIAGDILGNPGFRIPGLYETADKDIEIVLDASLPNAFDRLLRRSIWPSAEEVREDLRKYLRSLPPRVNLAEFAFLLLRQRRSTSPWSQQLLPSGYVPVCPFLDLHYLRLLLSFRPQDKHAVVLQRRCLADFWPEYYRYPGTRDVPADSIPRARSLEDEADFLCIETVMREIDAAGWSTATGELLSSYGRLLLFGARRSRRLALRTSWQLRVPLELAARQGQQAPCWRSDEHLA